LAESFTSNKILDKALNRESPSCTDAVALSLTDIKHILVYHNSINQTAKAIYLVKSAKIRSES